MMTFYPHERPAQTEPREMNTIWPVMSTAGVDVDDVNTYLRERGLSYSLAEENGWYPSRNAMDNFLRIVIPAVSTKEGHVYWQARAVSPNVHIRYQTPKGPRHGALVYVKAFPGEIDMLKEGVVVVEGPMDALAVAGCGYDAVALMGMNPGAQAIDHLTNLLQYRDTLVVLDKEPEASAQGIRLAQYLCTQKILAKYNMFRDAKDLAAGTKAQRETFLQSAFWWKR